MEFYQQTIHCGKCNEFIAKIIDKPKVFEVYVNCKNGHQVIIEINKKTGNIEALTEEIRQ